MSDVITTIFSGVWDLFTNTIVPGFDISLAKVAIGFFVISFSLSLLSILTGFRSGSSDGSTTISTTPYSSSRSLVYSSRDNKKISLYGYDKIDKV